MSNENERESETQKPQRPTPEPDAIEERKEQSNVPVPPRDERPPTQPED